MEQDEFEIPETCSACGAQVDADADGVYGFGSGNVLCAPCALARGGRYDVARDAWDRRPDLSGLRDESYGDAPGEQRRRRD